MSATRRPITSRLIVGNLDCEGELARSGPALSPTALRTISGVATLLRVFAADDDRLWTPAPVDASRLATVGDLPEPRLVSGPLPDLEPADAVLAWGETSTIERLRGAQGKTRPSTSRRVSTDAPLHEILWDLPRPSAAAIRRVHHRTFSLDVASALGHALAGARTVSSPGEVEDHLRAGGAALSPRGEWVLKAPFSAAGRWRFLGSGNGALTGRDRRAVENLFSRCGELLFEPWLDRTDDFGCTAIVTPESLERVSFHRQDIDARGGFRGVCLPSSRSSVPWLDPDERELLESVLDAVGNALRAADHVGPFTVDSWRHRDANGELRYHPLGEINARMTVGLVARALIERLAPTLTLNPGNDTPVRLHIATTEQDRPSPDGGSIPLLGPDATSPVAISLELAVPLDTEQRR